MTTIFIFYGFSYAALPYGSGTGSSRASTKAHSSSIEDGRFFLGHCYGRDIVFDQRSYYYIDVNIDVSICLYNINFILKFKICSHIRCDERILIVTIF